MYTSAPVSEVLCHPAGLAQAQHVPELRMQAHGLCAARQGALLRPSAKKVCTWIPATGTTCQRQWRFLHLCKRSHLPPTHNQQKGESNLLTWQEQGAVGAGQVRFANDNMHLHFCNRTTMIAKMVVQSMAR